MIVVEPWQRDMADDDDDVSVTSTVPSEQDSEYEVETILTEWTLGDEGETFYLVKWAGYPIERCTWEPAESFYYQETFKDWDRKKKAIADGKRPAFDLERWERSLAALEGAREQRKRRREAKRKRLGVSRVQAKAAKEKKSADAVSSTESLPHAAPAGLPPVPASLPRKPPPVTGKVPPMPPMVMSGSSQNRQTPWMASRQKRPADVDAAAPMQYTLSARRRLEKAKGHGPPPDIRQQDLVRPSDWPWASRTGNAVSTPKLGNHVVSSPTEGSSPSPQETTRRQSEMGGAGPLESRVSWGPDKQPQADIWRPEPLESRVSWETDRSPQADTWRPEPLESRVSSERDRPLQADVSRKEPLESRVSSGPDRRQQSDPWRPEPLESRVSWGTDRSLQADTWRPEPLQSRVSWGPDRPPQGDFWRPDQPISPVSRPLPPDNAKRPSSPTLGRSTGPVGPADQSFEIRNEDIPPLPPRRPVTFKGANNRRARDDNSQYRFWNAGEVYVHMYFGPEKTYMGPMRLCGLSGSTTNRILQSKSGKKLDIWFQEVYTSEEYRNLCNRSRSNNTYDNGWVEGYDDTEPNIYKTGELLRRGSSLAVSYPDAGTPRNAIVAYSPFSPEFNFLHRGHKPSAETFLYLNIRNPLVRPETPSPFTRTSRLQIPSHVEPPEPPKPRDSPEKSASSLPDENPLDTQNAEPDQDKDSGEVGDRGDLGDPGDTAERAKSHEHAVSEKSRKETQPPESLEKPPEQNSPKEAGSTAVTEMPATTHELCVEDFDVNSFFRDVFKMPFDALSAVNGVRENINVFYLMCPEEDTTVQAERQVMLEFLKKNESVIYSNRLEEDWERFVRTLNQGVVLFHESFVNYDEMPDLLTLIKKQFTFWSFSLTGFGPGDGKTHFQRLFPHGGVILITEDFMLREPDATVIILAWFNDWTKKRFPGMWKIMLRPNVLNWLLQQREPKEDTRKGIWLAMYSLIMQLGARIDSIANLPSSSYDPDPILSDGIHDTHSESRVISPQRIPLYGSRSNDDYLGLNLPQGLDQQTRNADHLAEFFAGWALVNSHRYRRFTVLTSVKPLERWNQWNHVEFFTSTMKFFEHSNIDYKAYWQKLRSGGRPTAMSEDKKTGDVV